MRFLFTSLAASVCLCATAQRDSLSAYYLQLAVDRIEDRLPMHMVVSKDTTITDESGSITVYTKFFVDRSSNEIEKVIEKTIYQGLTTEIIVYYRASSPILFTSKQWQGSLLKVDFDYYYQNNNPVYLVKRQFEKGNPDGDEILRWCYQLLKEFKTAKPEEQDEMNAGKTEPTKTSNKKKKKKKH